MSEENEQRKAINVPPSLEGDFDQGWCLFDDATEKKEIGKRIRSLRKARGDLTLDELSVLTALLDPFGKGISRVALSRFETGSAFPGIRELKLLARALRSSLSLILYDRGDDPMTFSSTPLELVIEDFICDTVMSILEKKGLVSPTKDRGVLGEGIKELIAKVKAKA